MTIVVLIIVLEEARLYWPTETVIQWRTYSRLFQEIKTSVSVPNNIGMKYIYNTNHGKGEVII